jgi:hypothetical protein
MLSPEIIRLLRKHQTVGARRGVVIGIFATLFLAIRALTIGPAALAYLCLKGIDRLLRRWPGAPWPIILASSAPALALTILDQVVSERSTGCRMAVTRIIGNASTRDLRRALENPNGFNLYLRDFDAEDSRVFDWEPIVGAVHTFAHRDEYLFAGIKESRCRATVTVANPDEGPPSNPRFIQLWLSPRSWQQDVRSLMESARCIIVAVPFTGYLGQVRTAGNLASVLTSISSAKSSGERRAGLAAELNIIVSEESFRKKTLVVNAFMDGSPGVTVEWRSLCDFRRLEFDEVQKRLS